MPESLNFSITGSGPNAEEVRRRGFADFAALARHVRELPYGRPTQIADVLSVLREMRGTCSTKHRLLAAVAEECGQSDIELIVGLYTMSEQNTAGVGVVLESAGFDSIPEAHCYLRNGDRRYDFTGLTGGESSPFDALLSEHVVSASRLPGEKSALHQSAIEVWAISKGIGFADAWALREACIEALEYSHTEKPLGMARPRASEDLR